MGGIMLFGMVVFLAWWLSFSQGQEKPVILINEVCAHNSTTLKQKYYGSCDYIEVYNAGAEGVNLKGYGLSKNRDGNEKFVFSDYDIPAGGYAIVFATGDVPDTEEHIFAPFRISDGDTIYLTDPNEKLMDFVKLPSTTDDVVYARERDGGDGWTTMQGSPWDKNENVRKVTIPADIPAPVLSAESGFYAEGFELEMEAGDSRIYYTLDGSVPNESSMYYEKPIRLEDASNQENVYCNRLDFSSDPYDVPDEKVDKAVIVRAVAINESGENSQITTATYFIGERFTEKYRNWSIVSIVADPEDLFGGDGIYVLGNLNKAYQEELAMGYEEKEVEPANYLRHGSAKEREAKVEIFASDRKLVLSQNLGLNLNGNGSRMSPKKSFRLTAREKYDGNERIQYEGFYKNSLPRSLIIRNGFTQNQWLTTLVEGRRASVQFYEPCVLFLNGEYWGIYSIQERCTEEYLENHFAVPAEHIILIRGGKIVVNEWDERYEAYASEYLKFRENITQWYESGEDCYDEISEQMDIGSYIDYLCVQTYIGNCDFRDEVNMAMWKSDAVTERPYEDGKWRWIFYDLDRTLEDVTRDSFTESMFNDEYSVGTDPLFVTLLRSAVFREQFVSTFEEIADADLSYENVMIKLKPLEDRYGIELVTPYEDYFRERSVYARNSLEKQFGISTVSEEP
ncbi:MAG: hypothetical protein GX234_07275 [Clostridiales bacterium]|nr:hypothetical protein [Clostridiales bacterium]